MKLFSEIANSMCRNNVKRFPRHIIAPLLVVLYIAIAFSPLAPLAMRSATTVHSVIGECSGDCDLCGCSPESRASHTCCCRLNKLKNRHAGHEDRAENSHDETQHDGKPILSCNCPCGNGKLLALWGAEKFELLPVQFSREISSPMAGLLTHNFQPRMTTRHSEPPDPPPKLSCPS